MVHNPLHHVLSPNFTAITPVHCGGCKQALESQCGTGFYSHLWTPCIRAYPSTAFCLTLQNKPHNRWGRRQTAPRRITPSGKHKCYGPGRLDPVPCTNNVHGLGQQSPTGIISVTVNTKLNCVQNGLCFTPSAPPSHRDVR
mmetsp:Transcript_75026/g.132557  ORF Transcript_75026/g.132557 Transcript_75026/m.132557 type:complete len:141 (+) Transcript_75026:287-709(+)